MAFLVVVAFSFDIPDDAPLDEDFKDMIRNEEFPFIRKPQDIDWNAMPVMPDDFDVENDPDVMAWREA